MAATLTAGPGVGRFDGRNHHGAHSRLARGRVRDTVDTEYGRNGLTDEVVAHVDARSEFALALDLAKVGLTVRNNKLQAYVRSDFATQDAAH